MPGACPRLEHHLGTHLAGQGPAVEVAVDAVCAHLADAHPQRPLVLSVHGPPGVGKSYFHLLAAQALYNLTDGQYECPGYHCPAYKASHARIHSSITPPSQPADLLLRLIGVLRNR